MYRPEKAKTTNNISSENVRFLNLSCDDAEPSMKKQIFEGAVLAACIKGNAEIVINRKEYKISEGELMTILPMQEIQLKKIDADYNIKALILSSGFINGIPVRPDLDLIKEAYMHPHIKPDEKSMEDIRSLFEMALRRNSTDVYTCNIQKAIALSILTIAAAQLKSISMPRKEESPRQESIAKAFIDMLFKNFHRERGTAFYAEKLCVTSKYLCTAVKSATGHTLQEWTNEITINEAKRYLRTTDNSIKTISDMLNFSTPASFIRFFRKNAGETPLSYRKTAGRI